jgi:uncharacterized membrane protein HdeD (DUF308 family)
MRRHSLDLLSLLFGLLFLAAAGAFLLDLPAPGVLRLRWLVPVIGIILGVGLLRSALRGARDDAD